MEMVKWRGVMVVKDREKVDGWWWLGESREMIEKEPFKT
jgi:hypothetical protein